MVLISHLDLAVRTIHLWDNSVLVTSKVLCTECSLGSMPLLTRGTRHQWQWLRNCQLGRLATITVNEIF